MLIEDAINGYWLTRQRDLSPHTHADYSNTFRQFVAHVGPHRTIQHITAADIDSFLNYLADDRQLSPKTRLNAWTALSALWAWAAAELGIPHIMQGRVRRPPVHRPQIIPYTQEECKAILDACEFNAPWSRTWTQNIRSRRPTALRDRAIVLTLLDAGPRVSELCDLTLGDYDQRQGKLIIRHGKGNKQRIIYIGDSARQALWRYLSSRDQPKRNAASAPLFASATGAPLDRHAIRHMLARAGQRAGVPNVHPHRFRHTFAITFLRNGGNVLELRAILGHEKLDTIRIYAQLAEIDLERASRNASPADRWRL